MIDLILFVNLGRKLLDKIDHVSTICDHQIKENSRK